jgi:hypothetical protein
MDQNQPRKSETAFEYFLYAAILAETGLAAMVYKVIFETGELARLRMYFAIFYFAFLAWAIAQLHRLHRARQSADPDAPAPAPVATEEQTAPRARSSALGLTVAQLVIVVVVFATAVATFSWALRLLP